ncbi:MAG: CehA/McbA family metallohydrolase, partial [Planctomicrobium sp.]|nr:CehA/McbA family metallohydrolase [Planctomicrobium sp.]
TTGYVACDTHVHTRTHSGHGDSTVQERMITLAGEGVELPIATDHNVQIDHRPFANEMKVNRYFTPVTGNEVTTPVGHFNIFPTTAEQELPNHKLKDWSAIFTEIERATQAPIVILNHARDVHSGVTPFAPKNHLSLVGENLNGWPIGFNAMEVINSGATQTDSLQLTHDWMNLLNAGHRITPVGSSDSHDVARHFVGQGRTYIRCDDSDPGNIDIDKAVNAFKNGDVAVSYGLLALLDIQETDINPNSIEATVDVRGPDWSECNRIRIFANGTLVSELKGKRFHLPGQKGRRVIAKVYIEKPQHDTVYVAVATGPGIEEPYWKTAFPYQPDDDSLNLQVLGLSPAIWYDADHDGRTTSAKGYAERVFDQSKGDLMSMLKLLKDYDEAVAVHVAHLYQKSGVSFESDEYRNALREGDPAAKRAFDKYFHNWRESQLARLNNE